MGVWNRAYVFGWIAILLILFAYEMYALIWGHGREPMLTQITVKYCPWWATLGFISWLFIHFALRYSNPAYIKSLDTLNKYKGFI